MIKSKNGLDFIKEAAMFYKNGGVNKTNFKYVYI